jgi:phosphate:Na+ symporter
MSLWFNMITGLLGGLGLFLLGMWLMTDGLRLAAGQTLERILARWTSTPLRGLAAGALITSLVQSSSVITVATIGFVNAGLVSFTQAVWVIFGANVGTTMTGWVVALVGLDFRIEMFALPLIGVGMLLRLTGEHSRRAAIGTALAGFGALFLGIDVLKDAFSGLGQEVQLTAIAGSGWFDVLAFVGLGVVLTTLMQSSSAALVVALTAASAGLVPVTDAAAVVIGANVGTTITAMLAAIGATPNAKRVAAAHVAFNVLTAVIALMILPILLAFIEMLRTVLGLMPEPASTLALFHTVFNVFGVLLMWPLSARLVGELQARFRGGEEDEARPRYLDVNVLRVPALALDALLLELQRIGAIALRMTKGAISTEIAPGRLLAADKRLIDRLTVALGEFTTRLYRTSLPHESAARLPQILRVARYYDAMAELAVEIASAQSRVGDVTDDALRGKTAELNRTAVATLALADTASAEFSLHACEQALAAYETQYHQTKDMLLRVGTEARVPVTQMETLLEQGSITRRAVQQAVKAAQHLRAMALPGGGREGGTDTAARTRAFHPDDK